MYHAPLRARRALAVWGIFFALTCLLRGGVVMADGGAVQLKQTSGPFTITVFASPQPLEVGRADLSVFLQDASTGAPILDAAVIVHLGAPSGLPAHVPPLEVSATHADATNKLLYAAPVDLMVPGIWALRVGVRRGTDSATAVCDLAVAAAAPPLRLIWPYLLVPPAAIVIFVLHQWLVHGHGGRRDGI